MNETKAAQTLQTRGKLEQVARKLFASRVPALRLPKRLAAVFAGRVSD